MGKGANWGRCSKRAPSRWMFILVSNFDSLYPLSKLLFVKNFFSINEIQKNLQQFYVNHYYYKGYCSNTECRQAMLSTCIANLTFKKDMPMLNLYFTKFCSYSFTIIQ
jgi:hypothetical protein